MNICGEGVRTKYWLRGSVEDDRLVLWPFQYQNKLYWASVVENVSGNMTIVATQDMSRASVFTMYSTQTSLQLSIYHNGTLYYVKGTEAETDGISEAELSTTAEWLSIMTPEIEPTQDITTGVDYHASFFGQNLGIRVEGDSNTYVFSFRILPTIVYPLGNCEEFINDIDEIKRLEDNWVKTTKDVPECFTTSEECYNGVFYNYCRTGQGCSTDCKGICELGSNCLYNSSSKSWECVDPSSQSDSRSIFKRASFWFIVVLIILFMSMIAVAIGIYQYTSRRVKNIDPPTDIGQEVYLDSKQFASAKLVTSSNIAQYNTIIA